MLEDLLPIGIDNLLRETAAVKTAGYRLVTLTCTALDENHFDILYHFDRELELKHLRPAGQRGGSIAYCSLD